MRECEKACVRRSTLKSFTGHYMVGSALDIGAGTDGLSIHKSLFPRLTSVRDWDVPDGDAQVLAGVADGSYDTVHSSHCLEHMRNAFEAVENWTRVLKPGGYLIIVVPDKDLYEQGVWPSTFNPDHKQQFTPLKVAALFANESREQIVRLEYLDWTMPDGWEKERKDYSLLEGVEPAIEVVVRKK